MGTFKLALKTAKKANKNALFAILIIVLVILLASTVGVVFLVVKPVCDGVEDLSTFMGKTTGYSVALAVEPYLLPFDIAEGWDDGHDDGLIADDTTVEVEKPIESLGAGVLEVLTADISLFESQTEGKDPYYAALYQFKGKIIFYIDLNEVDIKYEDQKVIVTIPQPAYRLTIDERNTEAIAVYQSVVGSVITSSSDGIISTLNTRTEMAMQSAELLDNYTEMLSVAKDSAEKQITALAEAVIINKTVEIRFQED